MTGAKFANAGEYRLLGREFPPEAPSDVAYIALVEERRELVEPVAGPPAPQLGSTTIRREQRAQASNRRDEAFAQPAREFDELGRPVL